MKPPKPPRVAIVTNTNSSSMRALMGNQEPAAVADLVSLPPAITGHVGRAWAVDLPAARRTLKVRPEDDGTIAFWVVEAPWAHPAWHSYAIALLHLRPMPDNRPTRFYLRGATHELWVHAMDPGLPREPMIDGRSSPMRAAMTPMNFGAQLIEPSDDAAVARIEVAVADIVAGKLSPDSDFHSVWAARFGDNMVLK